MAKTVIAIKQSPSPNAPPAVLGKLFAADAGKGVSSLQEDNLVPLIYILQAQSPQVNKRSPDFIPGAEAGAIWLRNTTAPIVPGETGILFQPCYFSKDWVEWVPRDNGGGFVGRHERCPSDAKKITDPQNPNRVQFICQNGNEVKETRNHIGLVLLDGEALPYVIPMTSSGHTVSRQWMFMMNAKHTSAGRAPSWACIYRLKTKERSNASGTWFTWDVTDAGWVQTEAEYLRGKELNAAFASGAKAVESPTSAEQQEDSDAM